MGLTSAQVWIPKKSRSPQLWGVSLWQQGYLALPVVCLCRQRCVPISWYMHGLVCIHLCDVCARQRVFNSVCAIKCPLSYLCVGADKSVRCVSVYLCLHLTFCLPGLDCVDQASFLPPLTNASDPIPLHPWAERPWVTSSAHSLLGDRQAGCSSTPGTRPQHPHTDSLPVTSL